MICPSLHDLSLNACSFWQPHKPPASEVVKCRALSGCCVATSLVACPGTSLPGNWSPWGGGLGGPLQQCAWPEALQSFLFALQWTILAMFSTNVTVTSSCDVTRDCFIKLRWPPWRAPPRPWPPGLHGSSPRGRGGRRGRTGAPTARGHRWRPASGRSGKSCGAWSS